MRIVLDAFRARGDAWSYQQVELDQIALAIYRDALGRMTPGMRALLEAPAAARDPSRPYVRDDSDFEYGLSRGRFTADQFRVMLVLAGTRRREEAIVRAAQRLGALGGVDL